MPGCFSQDLVSLTLENALRSASGVDVELEYAIELLKSKI